VRDIGNSSTQATDAELRLAHTAEHIAAVEAGYNPEAEPPVGDIYYSAGTATAARTAAGSTIAVSLTALLVGWIVSAAAAAAALFIDSMQGAKALQADHA
jgi:acetoin utilization deacetylase AcuC-like enzyme